MSTPADPRHRRRPPAAEPPWRPGLGALTAPLPHFRRPLTRTLCRALVLTLGRLARVEHRDRLAALPEPAIFALNHGNAVEALLVPALLLYLRQGRPLHFLADWMYVEAPVLGWLLRQSEPVAVYSKPARFRLCERHRREQLRRPVLAACLDHLRHGESIGIFPEGTRNRRGGPLLRGRLGLGELALAAGAGVPVVPIAIRYPAAGRLGRPPHVGRLELSVGHPLDLAAERRRLAADPTLRRILTRHVVEQVMAALAEGLGQPAGCLHGVVTPTAHRSLRRPPPRRRPPAAPLPAPQPRLEAP
jgi:1-acyl-sn-glycerol-3-phosphate acyltransferase